MEATPMADESTNTTTPEGGERFTWGLIIDVFDVLERHGYRKGDDQHTGRAVAMLLDMVETYEGRRS
jgi:hypothetical protein